MCRGEGHSCLLGIVEVVLLGAYNLVILMPLAGDKDYIARMCQHRGGAYQAFRYAVRLGKPIYNLLLTPENGL